MSGYPEGAWLNLREPRVHPLPRPALHQRVLLVVTRRQARSRENINVVQTFMHTGAIFFRHLLLLSQLLMQGRGISRADKERIVLRVAWRMGNVYEWSHHVALALQEGVTRQEAESFSRERCAHWSPRTRCFVDCVDELIARNTLSQDHWHRLRRELSESASLEFCMLVGHYVMVAININTLGIQVEPQFALGPLPVHPPREQA